MGIPRKDVTAYIQQFHAYAKDNELLQERGRRSSRNSTTSRTYIIEELWKAVEEADFAGDYKTKGVSAKDTPRYSKGRVDTMQKAGMLSDAAMGDELAAMEEKHEILINILKKVSAGCNAARWRLPASYPR
jgi:hypothetical protein